MPATIDTLRFAKLLQAVGMAAPQAEAFAEADTEQLVTKAGLDRALHQLQVRLMTMMGAGFVATIGILATLIQLAHR